jgi:hypothetical protein
MGVRPFQDEEKERMPEMHQAGGAGQTRRPHARADRASWRDLIGRTQMAFGTPSQSNH